MPSKSDLNLFKQTCDLVFICAELLQLSASYSQSDIDKISRLFIICSRRFTPLTCKASEAAFILDLILSYCSNVCIDWAVSCSTCQHKGGHTHITQTQVQGLWNLYYYLAFFLGSPILVLDTLDYLERPHLLPNIYGLGSQIQSCWVAFFMLETCGLSKQVVSHGCGLSRQVIYW